jgi:hypothetical protein
VAVWNAACVYATASPARAAGFFDEPKQLPHTKVDTDFDAIRGREEFMKMLAGREAGKANGRE